jgi:hypothetical protein
MINKNKTVLFDLKVPIMTTRNKNKIVFINIRCPVDIFVNEKVKEILV